MILTVFSKNYRTIQKLVKKQMQQEVVKLGLAPYDGGAQDEYEQRVMDIEQKSIKNPYIEWDIKYAELTVRRIA